MNYIADVIASIRLATSHHDPYEEWSKQTRREARVSFFESTTRELNHIADSLSSEQHGWSGRNFPENKGLNSKLHGLGMPNALLCFTRGRGKRSRIE